MARIAVGTMILLPVALAAHAGSCLQGANGCAGDTMLLQTHQRSSRIANPAPIQSGDTVVLTAKRTGHRITVQEDGQVHAQWDHNGSWQKLAIDKADGTGEISDGDLVILTGWTGKTLTVQGSRVHAEWDHRGEWQKFLIQSQAGPGPILPGSTVFLKAHTGVCVDADAEDSPGVVQARWDHQGAWQELVIEALEEGTTSAPTMPEETTAMTTTTVTETKEATTSTPAMPEETTAAATTTTTTTEAEDCVPARSLGKCQPCLKSEQCEVGRFCCPYMKKCVASSSEGCYYPIANCRPMCYDSRDNEQCACGNSDFPHNWQRRTCG